MRVLNIAVALERRSVAHPPPALKNAKSFVPSYPLFGTASDQTSFSQPLLPLKGTIGVVGAGRMGGALIQGLLRSGCITRENLWATAKTDTTCNLVKETYDIQATRDYQSFLGNTEVVLLCVEPDEVNTALRQLKEKGLPENTLVISVAAGRSVAALQAAVENQQPVIRAMPNTSCSVGEGLTILCPEQKVTEPQLTLAKGIFNAMGKTVLLDENYFDAATILGACGPAFIYLIMDAFMDWGTLAGLPLETSQQIATQMIKGAATTAQQSGKSPTKLKNEITTPGGVTITGIAALEEAGISTILRTALTTSLHRLHKMRQDAS